MSNSVFKEYPSDAFEHDDENLKIDSNLVILVNKNGSVSVDQRSLRNILVNKDTTNASVSVVRVVSPTPSLQDEIDADMKTNSLENEIFGSDTEDEDAKVETGKADTIDDAKAKLAKQAMKSDGDDTPHVCLTVENFYPPGEANKFANEVLGLAGISNPLSLDIVDYDFQRYVIQNDHCYTPLTSPSQQVSARPSTSNSPVPESEAETAVAAGGSGAEKEANSEPVTPSDAGVKTTRSGRSVKKPAKLAKVTSLKKKQTEEPEEDIDNEDDADSTDDLLQHLEDSDSEFSEYATSSSPDDDDDSDADFDVNYRKKSRFSSGSASKKAKAKQTAAKLKTSAKVSKKRPSHSTSGVDAEMEGILKEIESTPLAKEAAVVIKKKFVKQEPKKLTPVLPTIGGATKALKVTPLHQKTTKPKTITIESVIVVQPPKVAVVPTPPPKKEVKKPAPHVEAALFSDMTSLFSTPDIIKKVGDKANKAGPSNAGFVALTPTSVKNNRHLLNQQISVQTHTRTASEQEKNELDLIDSIVKEELKMANTTAATPATTTSSATSTAMMNENIPNIVKMLENQSDMSTAENLLGDLGGDALPDDLLQHVAAELAANKDLQDIIDTQVLGVQNLQAISTPIPVSSTTPAMTTSAASPATPVAKKAVDVSHLPSASKIMKELHRKDPIKIVRSDGRVITLPPIEAPATRASKRRAQNTGETDQSPQVTSSQSKIAKEKLEVSKRDSLVDGVKAGPAVITVTEPIAAVPVAEAAIISAIGHSIDGDRRNSLGGPKVPVDPLALTPKEAAGRSSRRQSSVNAVLAAYPDMDDIDSDESWNSEDDPDRLWCICKQPHNNRFMICCDVCEDWFHGKCVSITKAMGQQMEDKGIEWTCPNCIKKKQAGAVKGDGAVGALKTQQTKLTDFMVKSPSTSGGTTCITCSAKARPNSIYCSDECILKHAKNTTGSGHSKLKMPGEKLKKPAPPNATLMKNKNNRVVVFEPTSGRCLAGPSAPTSENLKQWLKEHPTFEVVVPGSEQAKAIRNKQLQLKQLSKDMAAKRQEPDLFTQPVKIQTQLKIGESKNVIIVKSSPQQQQQSAAASPTTTKPPVKPAPKLQVTPKSSPATPRQPRKQSAGEGSSKSASTSQSKSEPPIRESVKKTLEEQLTNRLSQDTSIMQMSADDIARFAQQTEREMYLLFSKDMGVKYKAKYRSLVFNIKDTKNQTLVKKIADKSIRPYDLVRMSPEELASKELAKWRENENKHSLEMIKKSELDMLACAKNYVLKTHKGEEVIEGRDTDMIDIDKNVSVEDVVTVLNSSAVSSTSEFVDVPVPHQQTAAEREAAYVKSYQTQTSTSSATSSGKKKKDSKELDRSRSRETDHHKSSSSSKHKRKRSRERSREREHKKSHDRRKDDKHEKHGKSASAGKEKNGSKHQHKEEAKKEVEKPAPKVAKVKKVAAPKPEDYNLIDKILESSSTLPKATEEAATPPTKSESVKPVAVASSSSLVESDQEPTSTVIIPTPPHKAFDRDDDMDAAGDDPPQISPLDSSEEDDGQQPILWTGTLKMFDVASFHVTAHRVSGDTDDIIVDLPGAMDIVGRISPETVWEYISKIRKSPNKEILILRMFSLDTAGYFTLYSYMETRKRLGVVKTTSHVIKDFYVMPLPSHKLLPSVLLPINGPGFLEGADKPDLLLGIVVKARVAPKKVSDMVAISSSSAKVSRKKAAAQASSGSFTPPHKSADGSFTPPSSPKPTRKETKRTGSKLTLGLPTVSASKFVPAPVTEPNTQEDMDEPYSPGGSDDEDSAVLSALPKPVAAPTTTVVTTSLSTTSIAVKPVANAAGSSSAAPDDELQRKMEEINRQIEASKMEIAGIAGILTKSGDSSSNMEEAFFSPTAIPALEHIALPSNLSEILASIKHVTPATGPAPASSANEPITIDDDSDDVEEYVPTASFVSVDQISSYHPSATGSGFTQNTKIEAGELPKDIEMAEEAPNPVEAPSTGTSRLAQLTEAELLSMVPDDVLLDTKVDEQPPAAKKSRFAEPPPPGLEDEVQGGAP